MVAPRGKDVDRGARGETRMHLTHQNAKRVRDCRMRSQRAQPTIRPNHPFLYISCTQDSLRISRVALSKDSTPSLGASSWLLLFLLLLLAATRRKRTEMRCRRRRRLRARSPHNHDIQSNATVYYE